MATRDKISDKLALDRAYESLPQLDDQRLAELKNEKQLQEIKNEVINREADRLAAKHGKDHPRVQKLQSRSNYNQSMFTGLDNEIEKASIKTEPLPANAWRLNGKVIDKKEQPVSDITIFFSDEKGTWIRALGNSTSDQTGYYALTINEELIELAQKEKLYLTATDKNNKVLYHKQNTFVPTKGIIDYQDIILGEEGGTTPSKTTPPKTTKKTK
jgi:hypothetical protein